MSGFFSGISGARFPDVVMNSGPLPPSGGLPAPLHDTADARINYNSTLLGDVQPYAYGEPGYQSSQNGYLNIPHRIQKICPVLHLPEARQKAQGTFELSHSIDDGDIAFVLRLNRNSIFCTGLKNGEMKRMGLGTAIDPLINLCTLNYLLSGIQLARKPDGSIADGLWWELLHNLDATRWNTSTRNNPITFGDINHFIRHCVRPFGITRGSEKQGGQNEATQSPASWPVCFVVSLVLDGKESNVVNIWHHHNMNAGDDLVLRLKRMPVRPYTLNHYYKRVVRQDWGELLEDPQYKYVWQLVPDMFHLESTTKEEMATNAIAIANMPAEHNRWFRFSSMHSQRNLRIADGQPWQNLGYWHIGRSQVMMGKYGLEEYYCNDLANDLKTNHLDITFQPYFTCAPLASTDNSPGGPHPPVVFSLIGKRANSEPTWTPSLRLETSLRGELSRPRAPVVPQVSQPLQESPRVSFSTVSERVIPVSEESLLSEQTETITNVEAAAPTITIPGLATSSKVRPGTGRKRAQGNAGSLLRTDGGSESHQVEML